MTEFPQHHHQKLKAEWTKSSASESSGSKRAESAADNSVKIKIIEQVVLCPRKPDVNKKESKPKDSETKPRKCQICEKSFGSNYEEHIKSKHELFECPDCQKKFKRKSSLRKHSYFHRNKFKYSCEDCNESFVDKSKFQLHCVTRHKKIERFYECDECPKKFTSPDYLKKHKSGTHSDDYKYACKFCNQKFKWLTSLHSHENVHTPNKKLLQCDFKGCSKKFDSKRTLERHTRIHQSQKYQCKICEAVTSIRKDNIMRHIRHLHTDIPRPDVATHITVIAPNSSEIPKASEIQAIHEIEIDDDDDDDTNDLIIDEGAVVREDGEEEEPEIIETPPQPAAETQVVNNRVNVIQCIGNPNKHQQSPTIQGGKNQPFEVKEQQKSEQKCDTEIQLPPKKKAIAKYNPIEQYRKILGLSEPSPPVEKECDEQQQIFPDHWRKRTSQNFLFRR